MQGTQEHDDTARAIALSWGRGIRDQTRAGAGVEREGGRPCGCIPPTQEAPLVLDPLIYPGPPDAPSCSTSGPGSSSSCSPNLPSTLSKYHLYLSCLSLLKSHLSLLRTEFLIPSFLSSLPLKKKRKGRKKNKTKQKQKESTNSPGRGSRQ